MTLDTWESLDRLARYSTVEQVAEDASQTVEETQADLEVLVTEGLAQLREGRPATYRVQRVVRTRRAEGWPRGWSTIVTTWPAGLRS